MEIVNKIEADYKESKRDQKTDREWEIFVKKMFYAKLSKKKKKKQYVKNVTFSNFWKDITTRYWLIDFNTYRASFVSKIAAEETMPKKICNYVIRLSIS